MSYKNMKGSISNTLPTCSQCKEAIKVFPHKEVTTGKFTAVFCSKACVHDYLDTVIDNLEAKKRSNTFMTLEEQDTLKQLYKLRYDPLGEPDKNYCPNCNTVIKEGAGFKYKGKLLCDILCTYAYHEWFN